MIPTGLPPQFLNYFTVPKADGSGMDKIPCAPNGMAVDAHDRRNWMTHDQAVASGLPVAFVLTDEIGWFFLDLDKCDDNNGGWKPEAVDLFTKFGGAWGEVSSSGRGLHVMGRCDPARLADRKRRWDGWLECYTGGRFIAFGPTGWSRIGGVNTDYDWTDVLLSVVPQKMVLGDLPTGVDPAYTGPADDDALLAKAMVSGGAAAKFGMRAAFRDLWEANATMLARHYPGASPGTYDASAADQALLTHLAFWTGKDMPRMDRLFRRSALVREKYLTREDYRRETIGNAAMLATKVYDEPVKIVAPVNDAHEAYLTIAEMRELFKGCVYILDVHKVLDGKGDLLKPEQFSAFYGGHSFQMQADGSKPSYDAFEALTKNRTHKFPKVRRLVFNPNLPPGQIDNDTVNSYFPADVVMRPGDVSRFTGLMEKLLPDAGDRAILTAYMAACVQHIGVKFQWAPVLQGCEGNGKTLIFSAVAYALGEQFVHSPRADQLSNQFNSYLEGRLFSLVEEIHMRGRSEVLDTLKPLITNVRIETEAKGGNKRMINNYVNWGFCTNFQDAILKSKNDRRYAMFFTAQQKAEDLARDGMTGDYFPNLYRWLREEGGYAMVAYWLKNYPIPDDLNPAGKCHRAPTTSSTSQAITAAGGQVEREIAEALQDDTRGFRGGWVSAYALEQLLREKKLNVSRFRLKEILEDLGFSEWGRAPRAIFEDGQKRPILYCVKGPARTFDDYLKAQSYAK